MAQILIASCPVIILLYDVLMSGLIDDCVHFYTNNYTPLACHHQHSLHHDMGSEKKTLNLMG